MMVSYDDVLNNIDKEAYNREAEKIMALVRAGHKFTIAKPCADTKKSIHSDKKHEVKVARPVIENPVIPILEPELPTPIYKEEEKPVNLD